jgi:hypothetical protein
MFVFRDPHAIFFTLRDDQDHFVDRIKMEHVKSASVKSATSVQSNHTVKKVTEEKIPDEREKEKPSLVRKFSRILTPETVSVDALDNQIPVFEGMSLQYYPEFQIDTLEQGDNQGRTYHLRTQTKKECDNIVEKLTKYSEIARNKEEKKSNFKRSQQAVLKICESQWYKAIVGVILAVWQYEHLLREYLLTSVFCRTTQ